MVTLDVACDGHQKRAKKGAHDDIIEKLDDHKKTSAESV